MSGLSEAVAALISGGVDSAVLLGELTRIRSKVWPIYIRSGLHWEEDELRNLRRFLEAIAPSYPNRLEVLDLPAKDLYGTIGASICQVAIC